jgi:hypothetical protein
MSVVSKKIHRVIVNSKATLSWRKKALYWNEKAERMCSQFALFLDLLHCDQVWSKINKSKEISQTKVLNYTVSITQLSG